MGLTSIKCSALLSKFKVQPGNQLNLTSIIFKRIKIHMGSKNNQSSLKTEIKPFWKSLVNGGEFV